MNVSEFTLWVPSQDVEAEWKAAGRPVLQPGPYAVTLKSYLRRPESHFNGDGSLSAAGLAMPYPIYAAGSAVALKQIDALVAVGALPDDAAMVSAHVFKFWAGVDLETGAPHPRVVGGPGLHVRAWAYVDTAERAAA